MLYLITYDVNTTSPEGRKRLRKVAKECLNYGQRVQNSVFECLLSESNFLLLKNKLENIINYQNDSIRFYKLGKNWKNKVLHIGKETSFDLEDTLIF